MYIISKCLLGENCKYNGGNNQSEDVVKFSHEHSYFGVCPECAGGLPTPRVPAEIVEQNGECRVVNRNGVDVTAEYVRGAEICFRDAQKAAEQMGEALEGAILQARSPSCGVGQIYNGHFDGTLIPGDDIFTRLLRENEIPAGTENVIRENGEQ